MITAEQAAKLWDLIKGIKVGMLTTHGPDLIHARPMHLIQDTFDGTLWFFTGASSGKVNEAQEDSQVCVTFADHGSETYVSLTGNSSINKDRAKIAEFWNPFASAYFPKGKDDPNLCLLRVDIDSAEYWDSTSSRMVQLFKIIKANITKQQPDLGENRKIG